MSGVFEQLNRWFTSNLLSIDHDKSKRIHSRTINMHSRDILLE